MAGAVDAAVEVDDVVAAQLVDLMVDCWRDLAGSDVLAVAAHEGAETDGDVGCGGVCGQAAQVVMSGWCCCRGGGPSRVSQDAGGVARVEGAQDGSGAFGDAAAEDRVVGDLVAADYVK